MIKKLSIAAIAALALSSGAFAAGGGDQHIEEHRFLFRWSFRQVRPEPASAWPSGLH